MVESCSLCFIGGTGRSGTTILREIFMKHPDVAKINVELRFLIDPDGVIDFYSTFAGGEWSPSLYDVKVRRLRKLLRDVGKSNIINDIYVILLSRFGVHRRVPYNLVSRYAEVGVSKYCANYFELVDALIEALTDFRYRGRWVGREFLQRTEFLYKAPLSRSELADILTIFLQKLIESILSAQHVKHLFEDTPWNILWFDKLRELLPEAKLVHIYRDPRDIVSSLIRQSWAPKDPVQSAEWCKGILERWSAVRDMLPAGSYKEVSLETLVSDTETVLRGLCDFWGIRWDGALTETDLSRSHAGRWKKDLTAEQQEKVNAILSEQIKGLGYEPGT